MSTFDSIGVATFAGQSVVLRNRGPEGLADRWAGPMGLVTDLHGVEEWREIHALEREEPDFEVDESRRVLLEQIRVVLSSEVKTGQAS